MSKKVLILVLSSDFEPYSTMIETSMNTWDSVHTEGVETIFYTSQKDNPNWVNTDKVMYFYTGNGLFNMGEKNLAVFEWALQNKEFDFVCRVNASCYVDKKKLIEYVQGLQTTDLFLGVVVNQEPKWCFGGTHFVISKDVIQKIVDNKQYWDHSEMEDRALSFLVTKIGVPFTSGIKSCSIDSNGSDGWHCISYCGESLDFTDFDELKNKSHFCYRVKQDQKRWVDKFIMEQLFENLK